MDPPVADRDQFYALWGRATERAAETGRPLLLVVDGLDEDIRPTGLPSVASLLPTLVDGRAHVLVASRPHPELPVDVPDGHPLTPPSIRVDLKPFEGAEELADLARQEIYDLTHGADADTAVDVLGLLTAAAGPLSVRDLASLSNDLAPPSAAHSRRVRRLVTEQAARSLEPVGSTEQPRYQFAHFSLLEYAQATEELADPEYRNRIHRWAERWRDRGWPTSPDVTESTPRYLLDSYPGTLASEPSRLAALVSDVGWVDAAIQSMGVDRVLADLRRAAAADPAEPAVGAMLATVSGQAHHLRPPLPVTQPGYVLRQLWLQAAELGEDRLASDLRARLRSQPDPGLIPIWTTRRTSRALSAELGRHDGPVTAVAVLPDGRVVSGGDDGRVLVWDPAQPGSDPVELGRHDDWVEAVAVLPDGRVVSGGDDGRVLVWDPAQPGSDPVELGRHDGSGGGGGGAAGWSGGQRRRRRAGAGVGPGPAGERPGRARPPRRLGECGGGAAGWAGGQRRRRRAGAGVGPGPAREPARSSSARHDGAVAAVAVLPDGRVVSGGDDGRVLVWDPARPGSRPGRARPPRRLGGGGGGAAGWAGGQRRATTGGCWCGIRPGREPIRSSSAATTARCAAVAVLPDGRVVSGGSDGRVLVWDPARPGTARSSSAATTARWRRWRCCRTVGWSAAGTTGGCWCGTRPSPGATRSSSAATTTGWRRWRCCRTVGWSAAGTTGGCWCGTRPSRGPTRSSSAATTAAVAAVAVLPDGRVVSGGDDGRVLVWDPSQPGSDPVELGRHDGSVSGGGGAAGRSGGQRRGRRAGAGVGSGPAGSDPVELGRHDGRVSGGGGAARRSGGQRRGATGGC